MDNNQYNGQPAAPQYQQPQQAVYHQQPMYQQPQKYEEPWSTGKWIGIMALTILLPGLGSLIALIICLTSDNTTARNYGKAQLIIMIIGIVLSIVVAVLLFAVFGFALSDLAYY